MIFNVFMYFWELTKIFWIKVTRVLGLISVFQQAAKVALVRQITKRNTLPFPITKVLSKNLNISRKKPGKCLKSYYLKIEFLNYAIEARFYQTQVVEPEPILDLRWPQIEEFWSGEMTLLSLRFYWKTTFCPRRLILYFWNAILV